jgi:hypothetical protein
VGLTTIAKQFAEVMTTVSFIDRVVEFLKPPHGPRACQCGASVNMRIVDETAFRLSHLAIL